MENEQPKNEPEAQATDEGEQRIALEEQLVARLREWFGRNASRLASAATGTGPDVAALTVRLKMPSGDEDGTLYLYADVEETAYGEAEGRVPGLSLR